MDITNKEILIYIIVSLIFSSIYSVCVTLSKDKEIIRKINNIVKGIFLVFVANMFLMTGLKLIYSEVILKKEFNMN